MIRVIRAHMLWLILLHIQRFACITLLFLPFSLLSSVVVVHITCMFRFSQDFHVALVFY